MLFISSLHEECRNAAVWSHNSQKACEAFGWVSGEIREFSLVTKHTSALALDKQLKLSDE